jgi:TrmH family RNA methyltransferase
MRLLSLARDLRRRRARERNALFVAEGIRTVQELLASPLDVVGLLAAPKLEADPRAAPLLEEAQARGIAVLRVTEKEFRSAAETESPQGVLAIARVPERSFQPLAGRAKLRILVLDGVQDPGNVGTLVRTAAALWADATVALPGSVDLWNAKVVRSAMGALFHHHAFAAGAAELRDFLAAEGVALWGADQSGQEPRAGLPRLALAVGNEGSGLSAETRSLAERLVAIPIAPQVESLNVAVAAGILLYVLRP